MVLADGTDAPIEIVKNSLRAGFTDFLLFPVKALGEHGDLRTGIETAAALLPRLRALA